LLQTLIPGKYSKADFTCSTQADYDVKQPPLRQQCFCATTFFIRKLSVCAFNAGFPAYFIGGLAVQHSDLAILAISADGSIQDAVAKPVCQKCEEKY
jgi:hypothetical protein